MMTTTAARPSTSITGPLRVLAAFDAATALCSTIAPGAPASLLGIDESSVRRFGLALGVLAVSGLFVAAVHTVRPLTLRLQSVGNAAFAVAAAVTARHAEVDRVGAVVWAALVASVAVLSWWQWQLGGRDGQ